MANTELANKYKSTMGNFSKYISSDGSEVDILDVTNKALQVNVVAGSTSGTEYTEGDTDATISGLAVLWEDAADTLAPISAAKPLPVNVVAGSTAGTEFNEDTAHTTGDAGALALVVRKDTAASLCDTDGDYTALETDANGRLHVIEPSAAGALTALQVIDDWDESDRAKVNPIVGQAGIAAGAGAVDALTQRTTLASDDPAVTLLGTMDTDTGNIATAVQVMDDWDESDRAKVNPIAGQAGVAAGAGAADALTQRTILASDDPAVTLLGTIDTDTGNIATSLGVIDDWDDGADSAKVVGSIAHDTADAGNPVKIGAKAKNFDGSAPGTVVAEDDRVNAIADVYGRLFVETTHPNYWSVSADYGAAQTNASVKATPGAGLKLYITDIFVSNGAVAGNITLLNGSAGTVMFECYPAINGGAVANLRSPIVLSADTALCITSTTVTTHSITVCGYIAP